MPPLTLAEKILGAHAVVGGGARHRGRAQEGGAGRTGRAARAGDLIVCEADLILGTDGSTPMAIDYFHGMGGRKRGGAPVAFPERVLLARDHYSPPTSPATLGFHARMEDFAREHCVELLPVGGGISFQVAMEAGRVKPGDLVVGADSHTTSCGAVGAFATGIGSADLAGAFLTGGVWLRVPESIRVVLDGFLPTRCRSEGCGAGGREGGGFGWSGLSGRGIRWASSGGPSGGRAVRPFQHGGGDGSQSRDVSRGIGVWLTG